MQITVLIEDSGTHVSTKMAWAEAVGLAKIIEHGLATLPMTGHVGAVAANQFVRTISKIKIPGE